MRRQLPFLAIALAAVPLLAGCAFLDSPGFDDGFGRPLATYVTGRATLVIDGRTIVLDQLGAGPQLTDGIGADVYWYNEEGWGLRVTAFDELALSANGLSIDRVQTTYWSASGYDDCIVKIERADATGVQGSATCEGLRWSDQLRGRSDWNGSENYVEGEPAFDATVRFEAWPDPRATPGPSRTASPTPSPATTSS